MSQWGYVFAGWAAVVVGVTVYAGSILARSRRLMASVPPDRRRWMETPE